MDYTPLTTVSWQRAMCLQIVGKEIPGEGIKVLEYYENDYVLSANGDAYPIPCVAVVNRFINLKQKKVGLNKSNLLIRDNSKCQYCGVELNKQTCTIDHIIPKSYFSTKKQSNRWDNLVICCYPCNHKKGKKTPDQAKMKLMSTPKEPQHSIMYRRSIINKNKMCEQWLKYIYE
jgi:uncharacterized protein (TIGR02646 family)